MVDILSMVDLTSISAMLAATGVLVGVVFAILELRNLVKTRQTDLVMRLHSSAVGKEPVEAYLKVMSLEFDDYNDYVKKYGLPLSENPANTAIQMFCLFFEDIGVLLHRRLVDINLIGELFGVAMLWEKVKPIVEGMRKQFNEPRIYEWFEYLYNEIKKREQALQQTQQ